MKMDIVEPSCLSLGVCLISFPQWKVTCVVCQASEPLFILRIDPALCVTLQSDKLKKSSLCMHASQSAQPYILILGLKQFTKILLPPIGLSKMSFEEILDARFVSQDTYPLYWTPSSCWYACQVDSMIWSRSIFKRLWCLVEVHGILHFRTQAMLLLPV